MPDSAPISVLVIEDNPADARLIELLLEERQPGAFALSYADTLKTALAALAASSFDVALLDLGLPDSFGLESVTRLRSFAPMMPIVVLTGTDDDRLALQAMQQGAQDYIVKGAENIEMLRRSIRYALERSRVDQSLRRSESQFRAMFEHAGLGVGLLDLEGRIISLNPALRQMLGTRPDEEANLRLISFIQLKDRSEVLAELTSLLEGHAEKFAHEARFQPHSGGFAWGRLTVTLVRGPDNAPQFAVAMIEDITSRKVLEKQLRLAAKVLEATSEGVFITDSHQHVIHTNPSFTQLTGYEFEDVMGKKPSCLSSGRHDRDFYAAMWKEIGENGFWRGEIWNRKKNGEPFAEWLNISAVKNDAGIVTNYVAVFNDITTRKMNEEALSHRAHHDTLTSLPNRALFLERLERALARAQRNQLIIAVLYLDLDHFKQINDSLGHTAGDSLLQQVSSRLSSSVRHEDTVARMGGDEFTLILEDINDFRDATTVAQKILRQFSEPFTLLGRPHKVTTSIGIALYPTDGTSAQELIDAADEAMYASKKQGRDSFRFASPALSERAFERQAMESVLSRAIEDKALQLYYQPIVDLRSMRVIAAEALLRWKHPEIGVLVPRQFLPLAKESGLIKRLGRWAFTTAFEQATVWRREHPGFRICVNISKSELEDDSFLAMIEELLARFDLPAEAVDIEVPEAVAMEATPATVHALEALRVLGVHIALDDFGSGHTDFRTLRHTPVDVVKIAPDFIRDLSEKQDEGRLIRAATAVAHSMSIRVAAKAIETIDQLDYLRKHHCDAVQGFLFSRPVPAEELGRMIGQPLSAGK